MNLKRIFAVLCAVLMVFTSIGVSATGASSAKKTFNIVFTDVTKDDPSTMSGDAKIKVSISGITGDIRIAQLGFDFIGGLKYSSIDMLINENDPESGSVTVYPNAAEANATNKLKMSVISAKNPMNFKDSTDICILTFSGSPGETAVIAPDEKETYCSATLDPGDAMALKNADSEITVKASDKDVKSVTARIKVVMDKVDSFVGEGSGKYESSGVTVKITSESRPSSVFSTCLNNILISDGGHRDGGSRVTVPTFIVSHNVLADDTYTVEVSAIGYVSYKEENVKFDNVVEITNSKLIPGDVNGDGTVDAADKKLAAAAAAGRYSEAADFNRDKKVDELDLKVFDGIKDDVPDKMTAPIASSTKDSVKLNWTKPDDASVIGYTIRYGTEKNALTDETKINDANTLEYTFRNLTADKTYYFEIAAVNAEGVGVYSDTISIKTKAEPKGDDSGSGSGSGGSGSGGGSGLGGNTGLPGTDNSGQISADEKEFTDLNGYDWAEDAIYELKAKGIISGISETEFAPSDNIKRGDFMLMLVRMMNIDVPFTENFADVPTDSYYYDAIGKAKAAGIAQGSGTDFMPEQTITRQDLITLAYRAFLNKGYITEVRDLAVLDAFGDKDDVSDYACAPMASMAAAGIIKGSDGKVNPLGYATRAETAVMCSRLVRLMK